MAASLLFFEGFQMRVLPGIPTKYPAINRWFDSMETLESYQLTKSDYYTHNWDLPPQLGGCTYEEKGELFELGMILYFANALKPFFVEQLFRRRL